MNVAIFTDNDFDKVNGVTTTFRAALQSRACRHPPACLHRGVVAGRDRLTIWPCDRSACRSRSTREMQIYLPRFCEFLKRARADRIDLVHLTTPGPDRPGGAVTSPGGFNCR